MDKKLKIREMKISDHSQLLSFWKSIEGLSIDEEDSYENMEIFLNRNIGLSYIAVENDQLIASIKGAQDGRRGYISHMAIMPNFRGKGIAKMLISRTLAEMKNQGIYKCNLYVLNDNTDGLNFWKYIGWCELEKNFKMLQKNMRKQ